MAKRRKFHRERVDKGPRPGCIYKATDNRNGKIYIGQARNMDRRLTQYRNLAKSPKNQLSHRPMERAVLGSDFERDFTFEIIECGTFSDKELDALEIKYIVELKSRDPEIGYNVTAGGGSGSLPDEERKLMHMRSPRKKMVVSYDMITKDLFMYWSCASAAEYIKIGAENIATIARRCHRGMNGRYCVFFADAALAMKCLDRFINARCDSIYKASLGTDRFVAGRIEVIRKYVIDELEAARHALKYSQHMGISGKTHLSDTEIDKIIESYRDRINNCL